MWNTINISKLTIGTVVLPQPRNLPEPSHGRRPSFWLTVSEDSAVEGEAWQGGLAECRLVEEAQSMPTNK